VIVGLNHNPQSMGGIMKGRILLGAVASVGLLMMTAQPSVAQGQSASNPNPVGTWLLEVTFLSGNPPPFKEMITLHAGGTATETNATLNAASGALPPPFNLVGSDGQGSWQRLPGGMVGISVTKLAFCGPASVAFCTSGQEGQQLGYLRLKLKARLSGNRLTVAATDSSTQLVLGPDPTAPGIDFGPASATGFRLH
jgi:hypothetical protein